jgi:RNA polymerase sigma factor (sigma-70 family)
VGAEQERKAVAEAIGRVLAGDVEAYARVYAATDEKLRAFVASRFRSYGPEFAEEVAVRAHERALARLGEFDGSRSSFPTWLSWQARGVASQVRKEWCDPRLESYDERRHEAEAASVAGPEELHDALERGRRLEREYERLDREGRLSIALHDIEGLPFRAAAARAGMSRSRMQRVRARALERLRRVLGQNGRSRV